MKFLLILLFLSSCSYHSDDRFVDKRTQFQYVMDVSAGHMAYAGFLEGYMLRWAQTTNEISSTNQELWNLYEVVLPQILKQLDLTNVKIQDYISFREIYEKQCLSGKYMKIVGPAKRPSIVIPIGPILNNKSQEI